MIEEKRGRNFLRLHLSFFHGPTFFPGKDRKDTRGNDLQLQSKDLADR